jgi:cadherin 23
MSVREDAAEGSEIMKLVASDGDGSSPNNDVFYRITSGAKDKFVVDSDTGKVG